MKDTIISFKLSEADKERIKALAAHKDVSVSWIIREALKEYFQ